MQEITYLLSDEIPKMSVGFVSTYAIKRERNKKLSMKGYSLQQKEKLEFLHFYFCAAIPVPFIRVFFNFDYTVNIHCIFSYFMILRRIFHTF